MSKKHLRSIALNVASAAGLVALLLAAAGSKPNAGAGAAGEAGTTSTTSAADETEPKVSVSGHKVPNFEYIRGTCENVKKAGQCDEFYGLIPKFSPDMCKTDGGNFVTSFPKPNPCPKEKLIGTCHHEQSAVGNPGQYANFYASNPQSAAALKKECQDMGAAGAKTEWIDPPAQPVAAASAATPVKGATTTKTVVPAKAPAAAKAKTK